MLQAVIFLAARPLGNCSDGDLRLVSQFSESSGFLQICNNDTWFSLCGTLFNPGPVIACGQLGFDPTGRSVSPSQLLCYSCPVSNDMSFPYAHSIFIHRFFQRGGNHCHFNNKL